MSPRARSPHPPADMRAHLLDTALRCFAVWGYEGTSTRRIAQQADVASGLLYHYFPNKEAILLALFDRSAAQVALAFSSVLAEPDPRTRLLRLAQISADLVRSDLDFWRLSYGVRFQHAVVAGLGPRIAAQSVGLHQLWQSLLRELGVADPVIDAALLFAAFDGAFQHFILDPDQYPIDAVLAALIHRILSAGDAPSPPSPVSEPS